MDTSIFWFVSDFIEAINNRSQSQSFWEEDSVFDCEILNKRSRLHLCSEGSAEGSRSCVKTVTQQNLTFTGTSDNVKHFSHPHGLTIISFKGTCPNFGVFKILLHVTKQEGQEYSIKRLLWRIVHFDKVKEAKKSPEEYFEDCELN